MTARGVENCFGDRRWTSAAHHVRDAEFFEVLPAFGRDELTAEFWSRKFFLFDEEDAKPVTRKMYGRTRSCRPRTGDDDVEIIGQRLHHGSVSQD